MPIYGTINKQNIYGDLTKSTVNGDINYSLINGDITFNKVVGNITQQYIYGAVSFPYIYIPSQYETETMSLIARMDVQPSSGIISIINTLIKEGKQSGWWQKMDCFYIHMLGTEQASLLNWIKDAHNQTRVNNCVFHPYNGFYSNTSSSLSCNFNQTEGVNFKIYSDFNYASMLFNLPVNLCYQFGGGSALGYVSNYGTTSNLRWYCHYLPTSQYANIGMPWENIIISSQTGDSSVNRHFYKDASYFSSVSGGGGNQTPDATNFYEISSRQWGGTRFASIGAKLTVQQIADRFNSIIKFKNSIRAAISTGNERVLNGGFDSITNWGVTPHWSISNGTANYLGSVQNYIVQTGYTGDQIEINKAYLVSLNASNIVGDARVGIFNSTGGAAAFSYPNNIYWPIVEGYNEWICKGAVNSIIRLYGSPVYGGTFSIDNLSIKEIL